MNTQDKAVQSQTLLDKSLPDSHVFTKCHFSSVFWLRARLNYYTTQVTVGAAGANPDSR